MACVRHSVLFAALVVTLYSTRARADGFTDVLTYHNDVGRTGQNLTETTLTPSNVAVQSFGKLFAYKVDGQVYAQPLFVQNVHVPGRGSVDVLYVATEHDSVYAFAADDSRTLLWHRSFINKKKKIRTVKSSQVSSTDITPEIGITGTPVIDAATGTLYVVAKTFEFGSFVQRLHALDIRSGDEKFDGPVKIEALVPGTGAGNDKMGNVPFDALTQNQRGALTLLDGTVYVTFASHGDRGAYHGWMLGYDAATLAQVAVFNDTPNGSEGGIWQSGGGPSSDSSGDLFFSIGNGTFDANLGGIDFGESMVRVGMRNATLELIDSFTPFNYEVLNLNDGDVGSSSLLILPDQPTGPPHLLIGAGKDKAIYVCNRDGLGGFNANDDSQIVQELRNQIGAEFGTPAYFNDTVYIAAAKDSPKAFTLSGGLLSATPSSQARVRFGFPGATASVSANGTSNAIVWMIDSEAYKSGPAILYAFDATDLSKELYDSAQAGTRDSTGTAVKFAVPTIVNGRVYVGNTKSVTVYGLLKKKRGKIGSPR
jgi:hypothetical protein